jgi:hypothetical protein
MITLNLTGILDPKVRSALTQIQNEMNTQSILQVGFKHFDVTIPGAISNYEVPHNLGFTPTDIIVTWATGSSYMIQYEPSTSQSIYITTSGEANLRLLVGRSNMGVISL